jgi:hypothetical protein
MPALAVRLSSKSSLIHLQLPTGREEQPPPPMQVPQKQTRLRRTIRFWLNCLVVASVLPVLVVTSFLIVRSFNQERSRLEQDTIATARALGQAVDAELKGARSALLTLTRSPLASGEFASFYVEALKLVKLLDIDNVVLAEIEPTAHSQQGACFQGG